MIDSQKKISEFKIKLKRIFFLLTILLFFLSYYILVITLFNVLSIHTKIFDSNILPNSTKKVWNITYNYSEYINNSCGLTTANSKSRIINGYAAKANSFPWIVSLGFQGPTKSFSHICGGSLINQRFILTAAHCVYPKTIFDLFGLSSNSNVSVESMGRARLGIQELNNSVPNNVYFFKKITIHPNYNDNSFNFENDLALIELTTNVTYNENISAICLNRYFELDESQPMYIIGWGQINSNVLKYENNLLQAVIYVLNFDLCAFNWNANSSSQICAGTVGYSSLADTCTGDTGGPLMIRSTDGLSRWFIVGIVSIGDFPCDGLALYTNIKYYYNWIIENT